MIFLKTTIIFILGLITGSFLNVVIFRLKNGGKLIFDRSKCPYCKKELKALDLIPVLSFILSSGKCRYCNKEISWQYPLVELGTAVIFALTYLNLNMLARNFYAFNSFGKIPYFLLLVSVISALVVIFVYDARYYLIPDSVVLFGIVLVSVFLIAVFFKTGYSLLPHILGMLVFSGFFLVQYIVSKGKWVGGGDIKLGLLLGLFLGWSISLICLFLAYIFGSIIALILMALKIKDRKDVMPFAPFLILSFLFCLFYGPQILNWYLNRLII